MLDEMLNGICFKIKSIQKEKSVFKLVIVKVTILKLWVLYEQTNIKCHSFLFLQVDKFIFLGSQFLFNIITLTSP